MSSKLSPSQDRQNSPLPGNINPGKFGSLPVKAVLTTAAVLIVGLTITGMAFWKSAAKQDSNILSLSGRIEGAETHIAVKAPARVKSVEIKEGDSVHKGQLLLSLDDADLQAKLKGAEASLAVARQAVSEAQTNVALISNQAQKAVTASKSLLGHILGPLKGSQSKKEKLYQAMREAQAQLLASKAQLAEAQAAKDAIAANLSYFNITSPVDGVCMIRSVEPGDIVGPGQVLMTLVNLNSVYLKGFIPEGSIARVKVGQPGQVLLDNLPNQPLSAKVTSIDTQASFTPENIYFKQDRVKQVFGIKLSISSPGGLAKPGMPADARLFLDQQEPPPLMGASVVQSRVSTGRDQAVVTSHGLGKTYRDGTIALTGMNLEISTGELFGLIGPDGAGKTTALKILSGLMEPSSGKVSVLGCRPAKARQYIGLVTQNCSLYPDLTVNENLRYEAGLRNIPDDVFTARQEKYLRLMNLHKFPDRLAGKLSGGMKQKLALCCALISQPRLLLLDEPTTGLDPVSRRELWQMLFAIAREGVTTLITTAYLEEAEHCNRVALLYQGVIQKTGTPEELQESLHLRRLEVVVPDIERAESILKTVAEKHVTDIVDLYTLGDRLDVLVKDSPDSESNIRKLLESNNLPPDTVLLTKPNLENVFVMSLREAGMKETDPPEIAALLSESPDRPATTDSDFAVSTQDLGKSFGKFEAVSNINLNIHYGEIFGLLGANGAGKTTTIKMLCGLLRPTTGTVHLAGDGCDLRNVGLRKRLGYMSQKFTLYPSLTVRENLEFYACVYEIPRHRRQKVIDWALEAGDLEEMGNLIVGRLPLGLKQRIAFGASIMHAPQVLFLDEPTAGIDPIARRKLWTLIRNFARNGTAVIVTTHYLDEAEYCHQLALMSDGQIITQGSPTEIKNKQSGDLFQLSAGHAPDAVEVLRSKLDWWRISLFDDTVHVLLDNPEKDIANVKSILQNAGITLRDFRRIPFSLEDAFIATIQQNHKGKP